MGENSYEWPTLAPGMALQPSGWVLTREATGPTRGVQWFGTNTETGSEALLYFPPASVVEDEVLFDEWQRQTNRLVATLPPLIQQIYEVQTEEVPWPFAVIESVDGLDLNHFRLSLEHRVIPMSQLKGWLDRVTEALDRAHQKKCFHGSLSPSSLVLDRGGEIRLLHFAWVSLFDELEQRADGGLESGLPVVYLSPQLVDGRRARATDDVYGFGATLFELITSQPPFVRGDLSHQIRHVEPDTLRQRLEDLGDDSGRVPAALDRAVARCLAKEASKRFQSLGAFWKQAWAPHSGESGVGESGQSVSETKEERAAVVASPAQENGLERRDRIEADPPSDDGAGHEDLVAPYYPPPPMTNDKRFGALFVLIAAVVIVIVGYFVDRYRESLLDELPPVEAAGEIEPVVPAISTNLSTYEEFAALVPVPENVGWLAVRTEPVESIAEVWLNTQEIPIEQVTPAVFADLPPGEVEVRVVASGYVETNRLTTIVAGETNRLTFKLQVATGQVSLLSDPEGVRYVLSRGEQLIRSGTCPDEFRLRVGMYQLDYVHGARRKTTYLKVASDQVNEATGIFESGRLSVESVPEDAMVILGSEPVGRTPVLVTNLPPGGHRVILKAPRHRSLVLTARVERDIETYVSKELEPLPFPEAAEEWENSMGMPFVPIGSEGVLFGVYEVTRKDFGAFAAGVGEGTEVSSDWENVATESAEPERLPVVNVSCAEAEAFCLWLTQSERGKGLLRSSQHYRLPTEIEWDQAVDLAGGSLYPWGGGRPSAAVGNYGSVPLGSEEDEYILNDPFPLLAPVGQFQANRFGLFDLGGNVREWCLASGAVTVGTRMVRGGSWRDADAARIVSQFRETVPREARNDDIGFRVVLSLGEGTE